MNLVSDLKRRRPRRRGIKRIEGEEEEDEEEEERRRKIGDEAKTRLLRRALGRRRPQLYEAAA